MPSKSKTKGNKFENDMVKLLNATYGTEEFSRTPNSGAMVGRSNWGRKQGLSENVKRTLGSDIIVPEKFLFSVECKWYANKPNYAQIIKGSDSDLDHWLAECVYDAFNLDLHPLLFFKTNNKGVHFALPQYFVEHSWDEKIKGQYLLRYSDFVISGIDTFLENAESIEILGHLLQEGVGRTIFKKHAQELLKTLED